MSIQAQNIESNIIQETPIMKNGEYRLKGLVPGQKYIIKVKIPKDSNIERALPLNIELNVNKNDTFGVDFIVFNKYKEIDIRGYLLSNFTKKSRKRLQSNHSSSSLELRTNLREAPM